MIEFSPVCVIRHFFLIPLRWRIRQILLKLQDMQRTNDCNILDQMFFIIFEAVREAQQLFWIFCKPSFQDIMKRRKTEAFPKQLMKMPLLKLFKSQHTAWCTTARDCGMNHVTLQHRNKTRCFYAWRMKLPIEQLLFFPWQPSKLNLRKS